jgi:hypothetical protein
MHEPVSPAHSQRFYDAALARPEQPSRAAFWTGWVLSAVPSLFLLSGALMAYRATPQVVEGTARVGFSPSFLPILASVELVCIVLYLIPRTAVLGALLLTAYFGGAVAVHARLGQAQWFVPVLFGVVLWTGLLLRRPALRRALLRG